MSRLLQKTFERVYCIKFRDKFSSAGTSLMQVSMTLLALSMSFNGFLSLKRNGCLVKFFITQPKNKKAHGKKVYEGEGYILIKGEEPHQTGTV